MADTAQGASAPELETRNHPFGRANPSGKMLFAVNDGVPLIDALEMAQVYLAAARRLTELVACEADSDAMFGTHYLVEMAAAVLDSAVSAAAAERRQGKPS